MQDNGTVSLLVQDLFELLQVIDIELRIIFCTMKVCNIFVYMKNPNFHYQQFYFIVSGKVVAHCIGLMKRILVALVKSQDKVLIHFYTATKFFNLEFLAHAEADERHSDFLLL